MQSAALDSAHVARVADGRRRPPRSLCREADGGALAVVDDHAQIWVPPLDSASLGSGGWARWRGL